MPQNYPPQVNRKIDIHLWWITALLITINVGLFLWQILTGVDASNPSSLDALKWGADFAPLTFLLEPQRLFTSMFFHFGLIHLMLNMWALYIFGSVAEQMMGRFYFIGLYLLAGLMGSLFSSYLSIQESYQLLQHFDPSLLPHISAGASGAVMGVGAALTILSIMPALPQQAFILNKKSLIFVMVINLIFGSVATGINNAAHIGGMVMGALLAVIWYVGHKYNKGLISNILGLTVGAICCIALYQYCRHLLPPITSLWHEILIQMLGMTIS